MDRPTAVQRDVIDTYATEFSPQLFDLSCPSPPFVGGIEVGGVQTDPGFPTAGGSAALRERIAGLYEHLGADDILVTSGASEALAALAATLAERGKAVAIAKGAYPSFTAMAQLTGARLVRAGDAEDVTALLTSNPTVPGGQRVDVDAAIAAAVAAGTVPVVDEVYRHIVLDGAGCVAAADLHSAAVSVGDLSKALGLGGLRIGWIATRNVEVREGAARWLRLLTGGPSVLSEAAACAALDTFDGQVAQHTERVRANAPAVYAALREAGWTFDTAELGMTVCAFPPRIVDDETLARLRAGGLFLLRSDSFGLAGGFRIGLLTPVGQLRAGLGIVAPEPARCLVVLGRTPAVGRGKTRLAAAVGDQAAHALARAFFEDTCDLAAAGQQAGAWLAVLAYEGDAPDGPVIETRPQRDGDLGERIRGGLMVGLERGQRVVLIGTDTPDVPQGYLEEAFEALNEAEVVIGPAADGGFILIGVRGVEQVRAAMFEGVEWSTPDVFGRTIANLERLGVRVAVLPEWEDIDDLESLGRLARRLKSAGAEVAPRTRRALAAVSEGALA